MLTIQQLRQAAALSSARDITHIEIDVGLTYLLQLFQEKGLTACLIRSGRLRLVLLQEIRLGVDEPKPRDMGEVASIGRSDIKPIVQGGSRDE